MSGVLNDLSSVSSVRTLLSGPWMHLAGRTLFWTSFFFLVPKAMFRERPGKQGTSLLTFCFEPGMFFYQISECTIIQGERERNKEEAQIHDTRSRTKMQIKH